MCVNIVQPRERERGGECVFVSQRGQEEKTSGEIKGKKQCVQLTDSSLVAVGQT